MEGLIIKMCQDILMFSIYWNIISFSIESRNLAVIFFDYFPKVIWRNGLELTAEP